MLKIFAFQTLVAVAAFQDSCPGPKNEDRANQGSLMSENGHWERRCIDITVAEYKQYLANRDGVFSFCPPPNTITMRPCVGNEDGTPETTDGCVTTNQSYQPLCCGETKFVPTK